VAVLDSTNHRRPAGSCSVATNEVRTSTNIQESRSTASHQDSKTDKYPKRRLQSVNIMQKESNRALVRRYLEAYNTGSIDTVLEFVHQDHIHHPGNGKPLDFDARRHDDQVFFSAFSKVETIVEDQIAEGNKVASRITMHCSHTGTYHGIPSTGKHVVITFIDIASVKEEKIFEEWVEFDTMSILQQINPK
jgi:predicted ester cyclase